MITGYHKANIISVPKHFPGYVGCHKDPHSIKCKISLTKLKDSIEVFEKVLKDSKTKALMFAHIIIPEIDSVPITRSKKFIEWFQENIDFKGLYILDSVGMGSYLEKNKNPGELVLESFKAGYDMVILPSNYNFSLKIIEYLYSKTENSEFQKAIDRSFNKRIKLFQ